MVPIAPLMQGAELRADVFRRRYGYLEEPWAGVLARLASHALGDPVGSGIGSAQLC